MTCDDQALACLEDVDRGLPHPLGERLAGMTRGLNASLRGLPDGTVVQAYQICRFDGPCSRTGRAYVYWPFLVHQDFNWWTLTHAATGAYIECTPTKKSALALIELIRPAADWTFTSQSSPKAKRAKAACAPYIPRLVRVS